MRVIFYERDSIRGHSRDVNESFHCLVSLSDVIRLRMLAEDQRAFRRMLTSVDRIQVAVSPESAGNLSAVGRREEIGHFNPSDQEGVMNLGLGTKEVTDDRLTRALRPS